MSFSIGYFVNREYVKLMLIFLVSSGGNRNHFQPYFYSGKQSFVHSLINFKCRIRKCQNIL